MIPAMKKIIVALLAVLYLGSSSGATIHLHYCMGKLVNLSFSFNEKEKEKCSKCGMKNSRDQKGCCKNEHKQIKIEKDQKLTEKAVNLFYATSVTHPTHNVELPSIKITSVTNANPISHAPPRSQVAIYICNCVFLI
jgi:hypothetical protein